MSEGRRTIQITLDLTAAQALAVESLLATWNKLAGQGSSRWTAFYADGDGNFHPNATFAGHRPEHTTLVAEESFWVGNEYRIDFDPIAWSLRP